MIGAQRLDGGLSNRPELFFFTLANTEVAIINEDDFYSFWNEDKLKDEEALISYMKTNSYFGEFGDQTLYKIVYELMKLRVYEPGTMILAQAKRSPLNVEYKGFYQNMISNLGMKIKKSHEERNK